MSDKDTVFTFDDGSSFSISAPIVRSIDYGNNRNGITGVSFGTSCIKIANLAFMDCPNLTSVSFPGNSVTNIGNSAFRGCRGLTSFTIPSSVTFIGIDALRDCTSLTGIVVDPSNNNFSNNSDDSVKVLYNKDKTTLLNYPTGNSANSFTIPDTVTTIFDAAFINTTNLTSIIFYTTDSSGNQISNVTSIGSFAFRNSGLTSVTIPDSDVNLGSGIFDNCVNLRSATIPIKITIIPSAIFAGCTSLTTVNLSTNTRVIGISAFENCSSLNSITIPDKVTHIAANCFKGCSTLSSVIMNTSSSSSSLPQVLRIIGDSVFESCSSLASITLPETVTSIGGAAFKSSSISSFTMPTDIVSIGPEAFMNTPLRSADIPNTVKLIGRALLKECVNLTSVSIGANVPIIPDEKFSGCTSLKSVTVPESVTTIGAKAFDGCTSLYSITLGESVISIRNLAFANCTALSSGSSDSGSSISFLGNTTPTTPMNVGIGLFTGVTKNSILKVYFYNTTTTTDPSGNDIPDINPRLLTQIRAIVNDPVVYPISDDISDTTKQLFYSTHTSS